MVLTLGYNAYKKIPDHSKLFMRFFAISIYLANIMLIEVVRK